MKPETFDHLYWILKRVGARYEFVAECFTSSEAQQKLNDLMAEHPSDHFQILPIA